VTHRLCVIALALLAYPAVSAHGGELPACSWQPAVHDLRHLRSPRELEAAELHCGIANPVDLSPGIAATIDEIDKGLRTASGLD